MTFTATTATRYSPSAPSPGSSASSLATDCVAVQGAFATASVYAKKKDRAIPAAVLCACCVHGKSKRFQEYPLPIVPRAYAFSAIHWPSTVQRTAQQRSFQTKYLMRSAFNFSFLPGVLIDPSGLNRQPDCKTLHVATVDSLLSAARTTLDIPPSGYVPD